MAKTFKKIEIWCFTVPSATVHSQLATRVPHLGLCSPVGPWAFMLKNPEPWLLGNTHPGGPKAPKLPNFPGATISHHPTGETIKRLICLFWRPVYTAFFFFLNQPCPPTLAEAQTIICSCWAYSMTCLAISVERMVVSSGFYFWLAESCKSC